ncbi:GTP pyrophosphokinase family protein [Aestuariibius sp. 2305UL40-4]|uniref:GTP pyrophosphokinase n=1 Tax=Aestuariibius violaceus TaxID=3234132 RepID=UPI00345E5A21
MASPDFQAEIDNFKSFYDANTALHEDALASVHALLTSISAANDNLGISKIDYRLKDRDECISKFIRKYREPLEKKKVAYEIKDHITDLLGLRVTCNYEDEIEKIKSALEENFQIIDTSDKTAELNENDNKFGYKGLHIDLRLNPDRYGLPEYSRYKNMKFEIQIRTLTQDAWSNLDHKIKYKKSIPVDLKRRVNALAALFEIADREFLAIRDLTSEYEEKSEIEYGDIELDEQTSMKRGAQKDFIRVPLDAFSFLRISEHFFPKHDFDHSKVDLFVQDILAMRPETTRGKFNFYMKNAISKVKDYAEHQRINHERNMNPFTMIRHCLYYGETKTFKEMLTPSARNNFNGWLMPKN